MLAVMTIFGSDTVINPALDSSGIELNSSLISGIYDYHASVNFDAYLTELGVPWYLRNLAAMAAPSVTISRDNSGCQRYQRTHKIFMRMNIIIYRIATSILLNLSFYCISQSFYYSNWNTEWPIII